MAYLTPLKTLQDVTIRGAHHDQQLFQLFNESNVELAAEDVNNVCWHACLMSSESSR